MLPVFHCLIRIIERTSHSRQIADEKRKTPVHRSLRWQSSANALHRLRSTEPIFNNIFEWNSVGRVGLLFYELYSGWSHWSDFHVQDHGQYVHKIVSGVMKVKFRR